MTKLYKIGGVIAVIIIIIAIIFISAKKVSSKIKESKFQKTFENENLIDTGGLERISETEAGGYVKRVLNDLSWFGSDFSIYNDLLQLTDADLIAVNNSFVINNGNEYSYQYPNIAELIKAENLDPEKPAIQLLYRMNSLFPNLNYNHWLYE